MNAPAVSPPPTAVADEPRKSGASLVVLLILGSLTAFGSLSIDMYLPSFPDIAANLKTTLPMVQLSLSTFFIGLASGQLLYGPAADRFGRKPPLYVGLVIYTLASAACALAPNIHTLIVCRFFQALGACAGMVIARAIVRDIFDPQHAARAFSLLMLVMGVAPILAPLIGGYVTEFFGWRATFWLLGGFSSCCFAACALRLPETHPPNARLRLRDSLGVYRRIILNRTFLGYTLAGGVAQAAMFAYITGSPFVFIHLFGIPADRFGSVFGANAFGLIACSQLNGWLLRKHSFDAILRRTLPLLAACSAALMAAGALPPSFWRIAVPLFFFMAMLGMTFPNSTAGALSSHGSNAGSASALLGGMQFALLAMISASETHFHDGTARPMTMIVGICGVLSFVLYRVLVRHPHSVSVAVA